MAEIKKVYKNWTAYDVYNSDNIDSTLNTSSTNAIQNWAVATALNWKQATLVSWTNIKTVNSTSLLGSWDIAVQEVISDLSTIRTNATNGATAVSWDSGTTYQFKVSTSAPASWTANNIITFVKES